jgi:hypothetical protein
MDTCMEKGENVNQQIRPTERGKEDRLTGRGEHW